MIQTIKRTNIMFYFLIFIEGYIGLAFQMLFIRQLTPEVGASAVTSSWIIGFFLLALAVGYRTGGKICEKPLEKLGYNLTTVGALGGIAASSAFIALFFEMFANLGLSTLPILIIYGLLFIVPVAYLMGQSLPLLIQTSKWGEETSEISGNALYLSTIGSFAGAIVTANVCFFTIGATNTLILVSVLSLLVGGYLIGKSKAYIAIISTAIIAFVNMGVIYKFGLHSTAFADVYVDDVETEKGTYKTFNANGTTMSAVDEFNNNASWYISIFNQIILQKGYENADLLILGAGGFSAHLADAGNNKYTYVDIDGSFKKISEEEFLKEEIKHPFVEEDARRFLIENDQQRDVLFLDVFSGSAIPGHLATQEFLTLAKSRLKMGGYFIMNTVMNPNLETDYSKRIHATIYSVFPFCDTVNNNHLNPESSISNVVYYCHKKLEGVGGYKDGYNVNELDYFNEQKS